MILQGDGALQGGPAPILLPPFLLLLAFPIHKKSEGKKSFDGVHIGRGRRMEGGCEWTNRTANKRRDSFVPQVDLCSFSHSHVKRFSIQGKRMESVSSPDKRNEEFDL